MVAPVLTQGQTSRAVYLSILMILKVKPKEYGAMVHDLTNSFSGRQDKYPKTAGEALDMLGNYQNPIRHQTNIQQQQQEIGMSFL